MKFMDAHTLLLIAYKFFSLFFGVMVIWAALMYLEFNTPHKVANKAVTDTICKLQEQGLIPEGTITTTVSGQRLEKVEFTPAAAQDPEEFEQKVQDTLENTCTD